MLCGKNTLEDCRQGVGLIPSHSNPLKHRPTVRILGSPWSDLLNEKCLYHDTNTSSCRVDWWHGRVMPRAVALQHRICDVSLSEMYEFAYFRVSQLWHLMNGRVIKLDYTCDRVELQYIGRMCEWRVRTIRRTSKCRVMVLKIRRISGC